MTQQMPDRHAIEARVVVRALEESAFRQRLLSAPRAAVREETGVELPPWLSITILEETHNRYYLVLPYDSDGDGTGAELSDAELESLAGGKLPGDRPQDPPEP